MDTTYGYSIIAWNEAREEMRHILIKRAKLGGTIRYSELTEQIATIDIKPESAALARMLGDISRAEDAAGRGMLSVIVVQKSSGQPGPGFFELAKELGRDTSDTLKCSVDESKKVHAYWSST